jgi:hypothetical protein
MESQETPTPTPRKSVRPYIIGGIIVLVLLASAAFVGGRLLNGQGLPGFSALGGPGGPGLMLGGPGGKMMKLNIQPSKELPQTPADVRGIFDHRQDNSIFVGTGQVMMTVQKDQSGNVQSSSSHSGPVVEIVITNQTTIYKDVTMQQFNGPPPSGQAIQEVLDAGSLDDIGQSSQITVWGKKTGDRFIADVLVYTPPAFLTK